MGNNNNRNWFLAFTGIIAVSFTAACLLGPYFLIAAIWYLDLPLLTTWILTGIMIVWIIITKPFHTIYKCHRNAMKRMEGRN